MRVRRSADSDSIHIHYLSTLCTQIADPKFPNTFQGIHCICKKHHNEEEEVDTAYQVDAMNLLCKLCITYGVWIVLAVQLRRLLEKSTEAFDLSAASASSSENSCFGRFR